MTQQLLEPLHPQQTLSYRPLCRVVCVADSFFSYFWTPQPIVSADSLCTVGPKKTRKPQENRRHRIWESGDRVSRCLNIPISTFVFKALDLDEKCGLTLCAARWISSMCEQWVRCLELEGYFGELLRLKMSHWCRAVSKKELFWPFSHQILTLTENLEQGNWIIVNRIGYKFIWFNLTLVVRIIITT